RIEVPEFLQSMIFDGVCNSATADDDIIPSTYNRRSKHENSIQSCARIHTKQRKGYDEFTICKGSKNKNTMNVTFLWWCSNSSMQP
ncbi:MAG TPA: hypothetical protein O0W91_00605, partial [Methanocorpusculum sp.]|nr:hypothetical protein [Methanocorpusculum sp.]